MSEAAGGKRREVRLPGREKAGRGKGRQRERKGKLRPARPGHRGNAGRREAKAAQLRTPGRGSRGPGRTGPTAQGDAATGQGGPDSASRGWEAWRTRRPSLLVSSDHSPPRSWGAPGNRAPSAPSVTPRLPRLTDPDPNPADRVARASRVVQRLRNLARAPPTAHAPPTSVTRQLGQPQLRRRTAAVPPLAGATPTPLRSTCVLSHFLLFFSLPPPPGMGSLPAGFWACLLPLLCHVSRRLVLLAAKEAPLLAWRSLVSSCSLEVPKPTGFGGLWEWLHQPMPPGMLGGVSYMQPRALALTRSTTLTVGRVFGSAEKPRRY